MHGILNVRTATVYGLTRTEIKAVRFGTVLTYKLRIIPKCVWFFFYFRTEISDNGMSIEIDSYYPRIVIEGSYKGEGSFNDYKLNARGYFNVTFSK